MAVIENKIYAYEGTKLFSTSIDLNCNDGFPMYKHALKVANFDYSIMQYPVLCAELGKAVIEANVFCNPEFFYDIVKFQNFFGTHDNDIAHNRCTCIVYSYHLVAEYEKQKALT